MNLNTVKAIACSTFTKIESVVADYINVGYLTGSQALFRKRDTTTPTECVTINVEMSTLTNQDVSISDLGSENGTINGYRWDGVSAWFRTFSIGSSGYGVRVYNDDVTDAGIYVEGCSGKTGSYASGGWASILDGGIGNGLKVLNQQGYGVWLDIVDNGVNYPSRAHIYLNPCIDSRLPSTLVNGDVTFVKEDGIGVPSYLGVYTTDSSSTTSSFKEVVVVERLSSAPSNPNVNSYYIDKSTNILWRWNGSAWCMQIDMQVGTSWTGTAYAGAILYNTSTSKHEGYDGTSWNAFY